MDENIKYNNYYELFEIHPKASQEEIKRAYRKKLKQWHPDKNIERIKEAEEITKVLNHAYSILSDADQRKKYDRMLRFTRKRNIHQDIKDDIFWEKVEKASPGFKKIFANVKDLYSLFKDAVKGNYKLHPSYIGMIGGGLLYFIIPTDFIPDIIPIIGFLDDIAVLTMIGNSLQSELNEYRNWKKTD
jgi:curved DNA-binding protein CbpA